MKFVAVILLALMLSGCGAALTPNIHKAQMEEVQTEESKKQTLLMEREVKALEAIAEWCKRQR